MTGRNPRSRARILTTFCIFLPLLLIFSACQEVSARSQPIVTTDRPTLRWEAPATREDGSRLYVSDIKEYRIYYRQRHQARYRVISRPVDKGTAFTLDQFIPGVYEFSVTVVDEQGRESRRSDGVAVYLI